MAGQRTLRALAAAELIAGLVALPVLSASQAAQSASGTPKPASSSHSGQPAGAAGIEQPSFDVASLASANNTAVAPCQASDLTLSPQDIKVAMGTVQATYQVKSGASTACSLSTTDTGWLKAATGAARVTSLRPSSASLAPGSTSTVDVAFRNQAPAPQPNAATPAQPSAPSRPGLASLPNLSRLPGLPGLPSAPKRPALPSTPAPPPAGPPPPVPAAGAPTGGLAKITSSATTIPQSVGQAVNSVAGLVTPGTGPPPGAGAPTPAPASQAPSGPTTYPSGTRGYDISWPQCGSPYPPPAALAVVGVNDGHAYSTNPCFKSEAEWAGPALEVYMNLNAPRDGSDPYQFGYNAVVQSVTDAANQGVRARTWWMDVETVGQCGSYWSCDQAANSATIQGALDALRSRRLSAGVYSTSYQWGVITGGYNPSGGAPPNWLAGVYPDRVGEYCAGGHNFGGGRTWLTQLWEQSTYDEDQAC